MALCRPRHGHSTDNSPHSLRVRILAPSLYFALLMDLFLGSQAVSTCYSLHWLMFRCFLVHDFKIGRALRCATLGTDILRITHLIPFVFVFLHRLFCLHYLSMNLSLDSQRVSTCFCLRLLMSHCLLVHDFNIGRAWRRTALGTDILRITHLIPFAFVFLHRLFGLHYRWIYSLVRSA